MRHHALALCLLCCHCGPAELLSPAPPTLLPELEPTSVDAPGPYSIGVTTLEGVDDADGEGRTFPIEIWYPARGEGEPAIYQLKLGALVVAELESPLGAVRDAPADHRGSPHAVVVFSHGFGGTRIQSLYLTEYLASHGFIVAAPDHVGNTFADVINGANALPTLTSARLRPSDVSRTLDELLVLNDTWPGSLLAYAVDAARVGVAGHSFGGFTTFRIAGATVDVSLGDARCKADPDQFFCDGWPGETPFPASQKDSRFIAALPQAPGGALVFQGNGVAQIDIPTMIQAGVDDATTPYQLEAVGPFDELSAPAYLMSIERAGHFTFSDMCTLIDLIGLTVEQFDDGCSEDNIAAEEVQPWINAYALQFLRAHLLGQDVDLTASAPPKGITIEAK